MDRGFLQVDVFVLQGRMDEARHLLSKEASANPASMNMYRILDELMKKMPVPSVCTKCVFSGSLLGKAPWLCPL